MRTVGIGIVKSRVVVVLIAIIILLPAMAISAPVTSWIDTFESGTVEGWEGSGGGTPPPAAIVSGGPAGAGDGYLEISTVLFHLAVNSAQSAWTGNYLAARVDSIEMDLNHIAPGADSVAMRIIIFGPGGTYASKNVTPIATDTWQRYTFSLSPQELVHVTGSIVVPDGTGILNDTLEDVTTLLVRHDSATPTVPGNHPPHITATVGIDNITGVLGRPDLSWTFDNSGALSYVLDSYDPNHIDFGTIGAEDPRLLLHIGKRYRVTVVNFGLHPLEILAKGLSDAGDTVLLSQKTGVVGSFESDLKVNWIDDGLGTVDFSMTAELYNGMIAGANQSPGYRCGDHVSAMRGDFSICTAQIDTDVDGDCHSGIDDFAKIARDWLLCNIEPASECGI